jgi:kynureninase
VEHLKTWAKNNTLELNDLKTAQLLDQQDPLKSYRDQFFIPQIEDLQEDSSKNEKKGDCVYLTGNSLGLQAKKSQQYLNEEMEKWKKTGVQGHFVGDRPWVTIDEVVLPQMARVVGAKEIEVCVMNSLTVNLHLLMVGFYRPTPQRHKVIIEAGSFPSDLYAAESQVKLHGFDPKTSLIQINRDNITLESLKPYLDESVAVIMLPGIQYSTGQYLPLEDIVKEAKKHGIVVGFDLAHAVGNVPVKLHDWNVDFACWCSYKYLNSGPGGIGGFFIHEQHARNFDMPRLSGWWGHDLKTRFKMDDPFSPIPGAFGWRLSNPTVFPIVTLLASLELFDQAGMDNLRSKSVLLTAYMEILLDEIMKEKVTIVTPRDPKQRGCQLSLRVEGVESKHLEEDLRNEGVVVDVRGPIIRAAPTPLYNRFEGKMHSTILVQQRLLTERLFRRTSFRANPALRYQ